MLSIYICDDIPEQAENIRQVVDTLTILKDWDISIQGTYSAPEELLASLKTEGMPGLYFLDIELHASMDGLQLAQQIRQKDPDGFLVFVTTHDEYIAATFQYQLEALDFIIKDSEITLTDSLKRVLDTAYSRYLSRLPFRPELFSFKSGSRVHLFEMNDILYAESVSETHQTRIYTTTAQLAGTETLKELYQRLDDSFLFCHRSYIVNMNHVTSIDRKTKKLTLNSGKELPVSVRQIGSLSGLFQQLHKS